MVHPEKTGKIGLFCTFEILVSVCNELEGKSVNRSEIFKPCNSEIVAEPPHCIIGTILVHSITVVSGGGNASKLEFSGGNNASIAEFWGG